MEVPEIDPNFEPQARVRSNTWPLRPPEFAKDDENRRTPNSTEGDPNDGHAKDALGLSKKTSSRRNAWGNLSYADLITKAIESSPEKRLTLSQIYDWMVQNVPYFKDKGESNSSAGWKNSIRHNLSLHSRFMRMQNEGTGKSSWWVINPDAKPGKTPRRRATSMDTKAYEKKRGRVKKKVDALRAQAELASHSNPGSEFGDSATELNQLQDTFTLSPQDFRARTSSNASSIGGRLSPIQSAMEADLPDSDMSPVSPWSHAPYRSQDGFTETLSQSLADMFVGDLNSTLSPDSGMGSVNMEQLGVRTPQQQANQSPVRQSQVSPSQNYQESYLPAPPPYSDQVRRSPVSEQSHQMGTHSMLDSLAMSSSNGPTLSTLNPAQIGLHQGVQHNGQSGNHLPQTLSELLRDSPPPTIKQEPFDGRDSYLGSSGNMQVQRTQANTPSTQYDNSAFQANALLHQLLSNQQQQQQHNVIGLSNSLLRRALTQKVQQQQQQNLHQQQQTLSALLQQRPQVPMETQQQQQQSMGGLQALLQQQNQQQNSLQQNLLTGGGILSNPGQIPTSSMNSGGPNLLPFDLAEFSDNKPSDLECDVDLVIKHELSMGGSLDFNFDSSSSTASGQEGSSTSQCNTVLT